MGKQTRVLLLAAPLLAAFAATLLAGPIGPPAGGGLTAQDVILNQAAPQNGKTMSLSSGTISNVYVSTINVGRVIRFSDGSLQNTAPTSSTPVSVYPATATASFPQGLTVSTVTATGAITGVNVTFTTGTFSGPITASNLSGTNTGDLTLGTTNGLSLNGQILSLQSATGSRAGALTSTDWNTFNLKLSTNGNGSTLTGLTKAQVGLSNVENYDQTDAANILTGTVTAQRLGIGTPDNTKYLRGDSQWITLNSTAVGLPNVTNDTQVKVADYLQKGAILVGIGTGTFSSLAPGLDGQVLTRISTAPTGVQWQSGSGGGGGGSGSGASIYPATSTAIFPYGFLASTGDITGTLNAGAVTASGALTGSSLVANSANISGATSVESIYFPDGSVQTSALTNVNSVYGSIYTSNLAVSMGGINTTPAKATFFTLNGVSRGTNPDYTNSQITMSTTGAVDVYSFFSSSSVFPSFVSGDVLYTEIRKNGLATGITCSIGPETGSPFPGCTNSGQLIVSSGDVIALYVWTNASSDRTVAIQNAMLKVAAIGATGSGSGTVTSVTGGYGISVTGNSTLTPTVNLKTDSTSYIQNSGAQQTAQIHLTSGSFTGPLDAQQIRATNSGYNVGFQAPTLSASTVWSLPVADGTSGQVWTTDGSGNLTWSTPGTGYSIYPATSTAYLTSGAVISSLSLTVPSAGVLHTDATSGNVSSKLVSLSTEVTGNLPVGNLGSGTGASGSTFWAGDGSWKTPSFATSLAVSSNSVIVSSPTSRINFVSPLRATLNGTTTAQVGVDASSVTLRGNTFNGVDQLVQLNGIGALPTLSGFNLTTLNSNNLMNNIPVALLSNAIINQGSLQSGSTAYPQYLYVGSSAAFSGPISVTQIRFADGTVQVTSAPVSTGGGGGGSATIAVGTGTASNFTTLVTSPTANISFLGSQFRSVASGTTNFISLNSSSVTLYGSNIPAASISAGALGSGVIASSLTATGVGAGSYTNTSLTVDISGRITAASNGSAPPAPGITGQMLYNNGGSISASSVTYDSSSSSVTFPGNIRYNIGTANVLNVSSVTIGNLLKLTTGEIYNVFDTPIFKYEPNSGGIFVGEDAGSGINSGTTPSAIFGYHAAGSATSLDRGTLIGSNAGNALSGGDDNTFIGWDTGYLTTSGDNNTFVGSDAGASVTTGSGNTYVGSDVNGLTFYNQTGDNNTAIGYLSAQSNGTQNKRLMIGYNAQSKCDNCGVIGDPSDANFMLAIGTDTPRSKLDVYGGIRSSTLTVTSTAVFSGAASFGGGFGTSGQVLTSNGSGAPTWQTSSGGSSIYAATATASLPFGYSASTGVFTSSVQARDFIQTRGSANSRFNGTLFTLTASSAVTNTTNAINLMGSGVDAFGTSQTGFTLPANFLEAGRSLKIKASGVYGSTTTTPGNFTFNLKIGTFTVVSTATFALTGTQTNQGWIFVANLTQRSVGGSGSFFAQGALGISDNTNYGRNVPMINTSATTIDTTLAGAITLNAQFSVADALNTFTVTNLVIGTE